MQVFIVAVGSHGDVLPLLAIAAELRRRGHAVTLAAPAPFAAMAARADLPFFALGTEDDYRLAATETELWRPWRGVEAMFRHVSAATEPVYDWLAGNARPGESIVLASTLALGARVAQEKLGLDVVTVHLMPLLARSRTDPPILPGLPLSERLPARFRHWIGRGADRFVIGPAALPALNEFRARLDLPPVLRLRRWWSSPQRVLFAFPRWYAAPQPHRMPQSLQVGFPLADRFGDVAELEPAVARFLDEGPPLAFTYGSAMSGSQGFFRTALRICERLGRRGLLLAPQGGQVPTDLPASVLHVPYAPFSRVLPRCAALIHHGGIGTVAQALAAGIPQLVVPVAFDHFDEARWLQRLGVGTSLSRRRFTPARATSTLHRLLTDPHVAQACAAAKARMAQEDGVGEACDAVEAFARTVRSSAA
ncbi:glycosyl transferase [Methylorubrum zatmanii]|nr:nucleotide disphospho-sugar-binding domain-containing protein [Methylorubrum zatmanii]ARO55885.1 glycosyl transferase [Methylorubrum zatmanii]